MAWDHFDEATREPNCWDTAAPVFILGADGQAHETRPTTSLAADLARPSKGAGPSVRRQSEERPIAVAATRVLPPSEEGYRRAGRVSVADRPLCGFGDSGKLRRSLGSPGSEATTAPSSRRSSTGSVREAREVRRVPCRAYDPIEKLLSMGVDKDSARAALSAVGGDVEKAMRLVLEDSKAHVSREACDWEFEGDKGWVPFDPESDGILQAAVDQGKEACELRFNRQRYLVDFTSLTQLNLTTQRSRRIRRRSGAASSSAPAPRAAAPAHERGPAPLPAPATEPPEPSEARSCTSVAKGPLPQERARLAKVPGAR